MPTAAVRCMMPPRSCDDSLDSAVHGVKRGESGHECDSADDGADAAINRMLNRTGWPGSLLPGHRLPGESGTFEGVAASKATSSIHSVEKFS
jgi:hypothetical protein